MDLLNLSYLFYKIHRIYLIYLSYLSYIFLVYPPTWDVGHVCGRGAGQGRVPHVHL